MASAKISPQSLAEEIANSEQPFIDAATKAFRDRFAAEYRRLRAYAIEGGVQCINLNVVVACNFNPQSKSVTVSSAPAYEPGWGTSSAPL